MGFCTKCHQKYSLASSPYTEGEENVKCVQLFCRNNLGSSSQSKLTSLYHAQKYQRVSNKYDLSKKN